MVKSPAKNIRLLLVDDHALFRASVARLLQAEPGFEVVADCSSCSDDFEHQVTGNRRGAAGPRPWRRNEGRVFWRASAPHANKGKVLLVTAGVSQRDVPSLIRKGISGVHEARLSRRIDPRNSRGDGGKGAVSAGFASQRPFEGTQEPGTSQSRVRFTERERRVLSAVFEGLRE